MFLGSTFYVLALTESVGKKSMKHQTGNLVVKLLWQLELDMEKTRARPLFGQLS